MVVSTELLRFVHSNDSRRVTIESVEDLGGTESRDSFEASASFDIHGIASRGSPDLYLGGVADDGDIVIEHWRLKPQGGEPVLERALNGALIRGTPGSGTAGSVPAIGSPIASSTPYPYVEGGTAIPFPDRTSPRRLARNELYRGSVVQDIVAMNVDPEGRFLLFLGDDDTLYRLTLDASRALEALYDSDDLWTLSRAEYLIRFQHVTEGRVWVLGFLPEVSSDGTGELQLDTLLIDADNDGLFDSTGIFEYDQLHAMGMISSDAWEDDFLLGP